MEQSKAFSFWKIIHPFPRHHSSAGEGQPMECQCADTTRAKRPPLFKEAHPRTELKNLGGGFKAPMVKEALQELAASFCLARNRGSRTTDSEIISVLRENPLQEGQRELPRRQTRHFGHDNGGSRVAHHHSCCREKNHAQYCRKANFPVKKKKKGIL